MMIKNTVALSLALALAGVVGTATIAEAKERGNGDQRQGGGKKVGKKKGGGKKGANTAKSGKKKSDGKKFAKKDSGPKFVVTINSGHGRGFYGNRGPGKFGFANSRRRFGLKPATRIRARLSRQASRITQGVRSGALVPHETRMLRAQNKRIRARMRRWLIGHNRLRPVHHAKLMQALDGASYRIRSEKNDAQRRGGRFNKGFRPRYGKRNW